MFTSRSQQILFGAVAAASIFAFGWWAGQTWWAGQPSRAPARLGQKLSAPAEQLSAAPGAPAPPVGSGVRLVIDTDAIQLLPDASLSIDPITAPQPSSTTATSAQPPAVSPTSRGAPARDR